MFFANEQRDNVREENPGISFGMSCPTDVMTSTDEDTHNTGQVGKVLGERWKALNGKQREPYEAKAKNDKERYESEKASYNVSRTHTHLTTGRWPVLTLLLRQANDEEEDEE